MTDGLALAGGLVKALADHGIVAPLRDDHAPDLVGVHLSFDRSELDGVLMKTWEDKEGRIHVAARWKPESGKPEPPASSTLGDYAEMEQWEPDVIEKSGKPEDYK